MREKLTLKVPEKLATMIAGAATDDEKLLAASGKVDVSPASLATMLFFLCHDKNPIVRQMAAATLRSLSEDVAVEVAGDDTVHPKVLDAVARLHWVKQDVADRLSENPSLAKETAEFLSAQGLDIFVEVEKDFLTVDSECPAEAESPSDEEGINEESEEFKTKYQQAQSMGIGEKIKAGLTGDKEWRMILIKDSNKLVSGSVIKNPRITEPEILQIAKSAVQNDEVMRLICSNKEWVKNYEIRKALVVNSKTPLPFALRYMGSLTEKDLGFLAKSKNISTVLSTQARRALSAKKKH